MILKMQRITRQLGLKGSLSTIRLFQSNAKGIQKTNRLGQRIIRRGLSSFLLDISSEHVETNSCKNQSDLARALKSRFQSLEAFEAFELVDRALFLPSNSGEYREPYANKPQSLGHGGATMSSPLHLAQVLDWVHVHAHLSKATNVLDLGCGSGWLTAAIFASIDKNNNGSRVVAVDRVPELLVHAKTSLAKCPVTKHGMEQNRIILLDAYNEKGDFNLQKIKQASSSSSSAFDVIHVGFTFNPKQDKELVQSLCGMLSSTNPQSRMLAGWGHDLCLFDSKGFRKEIAHIPGMAAMEYGVYVKPMSRTERMEKAKKALDEWKAEFEAKHKRKPSKDDLFGDAKAAQLFKDFSSATKLA